MFTTTLWNEFPHKSSHSAMLCGAGNLLAGSCCTVASDLDFFSLEYPFSCVSARFVGRALCMQRILILMRERMFRGARTLYAANTHSHA